MKLKIAVVFVVAMAALTAAFALPPVASDAAVPKYNASTEAVIKGTVQEVRDRQCPVSGGMGSHVVLKLADGTTIEVHLAATKFVKEYDLVFNIGDQLEVTGSKVQFEGVETIFAREVKRGNDVYVFVTRMANLSGKGFHSDQLFARETANKNVSASGNRLAHSPSL